MPLSPALPYKRCCGGVFLKLLTTHIFYNRSPSYLSCVCVCLIPWNLMEKCSFFLKCRNRGLPAADLQAPVLPMLAATVPPAIIWPFLSPSLFSKQTRCCSHLSTIPINTLGKHWWGGSVKYELSCARRDLISPFHLWQQMISGCSWKLIFLSAFFASSAVFFASSAV